MISSVVIPAYKKVDLLRECLERFETQTVKDFEVVVVSDGCEEVNSFLTSYKAKFSLQYFDTGYDGFGVALACNKGIYEANGEQIIIIGPDCLVTPTFIELHQQYFEQGLLIAGDIVTVELDDFDCEEVIMGEMREVFRTRFEPDGLEAVEFGLGTEHLVFSGNISFAKSDAYRLGGFDVVNFLDQGGCDTDFARRWLLYYGRLKFIRNSVGHVGIMSNVYGSVRSKSEWSRDRLAELSNRLAPVVPFIKEV
jgi:glycosyltransferase involved in cell wall biosynthesis